jgi:hypothetical protein
MKLWQYRYLFLTVGIGLFFISSCCDPVPKNSLPLVIDTSYTDTAIRDAIDVTIPGDIPPDPLDSGYYPIYSLDIKNTGTEADTFKISYLRATGSFGIPLTAQQYVLPGETKTFRTYGPIPSNSLDSAKYRYLDFFVRTADSISLSVIQPTITIHYGESPNGAEQCGSPGKDITVNPLKLKHK